MFEAVFGWPVSGGGDQNRPPRPGQAVPVSPFLTFAVAVHRSAIELASMGHVAERTGPRQRIPLFDAPALREFLGSPDRKLFLAELLASFTRVASGRYRVRGGGGRTRTRRFSELDPVRLAGLLDGVPTPSGPGCIAGSATSPCSWPGCSPTTPPCTGSGRRVSPGCCARPRCPPPSRSGWPRCPPSSCSSSWAPGGTGPRYGLAPVRTARLDVVADVAGRFQQARRVLNHVADRYLFTADHPWFAPPAR